ncbi:MAG: hypothetical protein ACK44N_10785 [Bacteroidota bacterium]
MKEKFFTLLIVFFSINLCAQMPQEWPYEVGKELDNHFYNLSLKYKLVKSISNKGGIKNIKLFVDSYNSGSDDGSDDFPAWDHKAIIQVNDYYYEFLIGKPYPNGSYDLRIDDIVGLKKRSEIIVNSGCHSDGGCLNETFVIFNHETGPISVIKLDMFDGFESNIKTGEIILTNSMLYSEKSDSCYSISQSYKLSKYSIVKTKTFFKKRRVECVG